MPAGRGNFRPLAERLAEIDINVTRNIEFVKDVDIDEELVNAPEEVERPHFVELMDDWAHRNRTQDFSDCTVALLPFTRSLPMLVFNLGAIVDILLAHASKPKSMALEPVLMLLGALARDVRNELVPHFGRIFAVLAKLLDVAALNSEQNTETLEQVFQCIAYLLKYLARYVATDLPSYLSSYAPLLRHRKPYIRNFAAETLAYVLRRLRANRIEGALSDIFSLFRDPGRTEQDLSNLSDSVSVLLFEAVRGVQKRFHSQLSFMLRPLLKVHVKGEDMGDCGTSSAARAAELWAAKTSLLRMRDYAGSIDGAADVLELVFKQFRNSIRRYTAAIEKAKTDGAPVVAQKEKEEQKEPAVLDISVEEQEVLFYVDLLVNWLYAKPRPRIQEEETSGWSAFAEAALNSLAVLLEAAHQAPMSCRDMEHEEQHSEFKFPPLRVRLSEVCVRAVALIWRRLPKHSQSHCEDDVVEVLLPPTAPVSLPLGGSALQAGEALSAMSAMLLPEALPGIESTPLFPAVLAAAVSAAGRCSPESGPELRVAAAALCGALLRGSGGACIVVPRAASGGVDGLADLALAEPGSRTALVERLLASAEAAAQRLAAGAAADVAMAEVCAAAHCVLSLCDACSEASPARKAATGIVVTTSPADVAGRFARMLRRLSDAGGSDDARRSRLALTRGRVLACATVVLPSGAADVGSAAASDSFPAGAQRPTVAAEHSFGAWPAWLLAWRLAASDAAPIAGAAVDALARMVASCEGGAPVLLRGVDLGPTMASCRAAAGCRDAQLRRGAIRLALMLPDVLLLRCLSRPVPVVERALLQPDTSQAVVDWSDDVAYEEASWREVEDQKKVPSAATAREMLELCRQLESLEVDIETERLRAGLVRKIALCIRQLPTRCWVASFGMQLLLGQLHVRFSRAWDSAQEAILEVSGHDLAEEALSRPAETKPNKKKRKRKGQGTAAAAADDGDVAAADGAKANEPSKPAEDPSAGAAAEAPAPAQAAAEEAAGADEAAAPPAKRRKQRAEGNADEVEPEELHIDPWLTLVPGSVSVDWSDAPLSWWYLEATWLACVRLIVAHQTVPEGEDGDEAKPQRAPLPERKKRKVMRWSTTAEGPMDLTEAALWKAGGNGWRQALDTVWEELQSYDITSTVGVTLHNLAWGLATKLLEKCFWNAKPGNLMPWQNALGEHHSEWLLATLISHLRDRYGRGRCGRKGSRPSLLHALQGVAAMPSIEVCAPQLVQVCVHGCLHWLLLESDTQMQQLAVTILARCKRAMPHIGQCESSLKNLCDDSKFRGELVYLSVTGASQEQAAATEASQSEEVASRGALFKHRAKLLPAVVRILFSKTTKRGKAIDKRSTLSRRRASVFSYLSALTEEGGLPELLLVLLERILLVIVKRDESKPGAQGEKSMIVSTTRKAAALRRMLSAPLEAGAASTAEWWADRARDIAGLDAEDGGAARTGEKFTALAKKARAPAAPAAPADGEGEEEEQDDGEQDTSRMPCGWAWPCGSKGRWAIVDPMARLGQWLGLLQSLGDVIPQMAQRLVSHAPMLMRLIASIIERVGGGVRTMTKLEQLGMMRPVLRLAILRARDLFERYVEIVPELIASLKPAAATLDFLLGRLPSTSGAVEVSAIVQFVQSWTHEPALFRCFEELCPAALPHLFRVPAGPVVAARIASDGSAGGVVTIVTEMVLRLCHGGVTDPKSIKKARRHYLDVRREQRKRKRTEGDSDDEDDEGSGDDRAEDAAADAGITRAEMEEYSKRGVALLQPHVDVLLTSFQALIRKRMAHKPKTSSRPFANLFGGRRPVKRRNSPHVQPAYQVVTTGEMKALAAVAEWSTEPLIARQLIALLVTAVADGIKDRRANLDLLQLMVASVRRLIFVGLEGAKDAPVAKAGPGRSKKKSAAAAAAECLDEIEPGHLAGHVAHQLGRMLGKVRDVALRESLGELLVELEALRLFGAGASAYLEAAAALPAAARWRPDVNVASAERLGSGDKANGAEFRELHIAHLVCSLNMLRRGGLKEPDVDLHVEVLQLLADEYILGAKQGVEAAVTVGPGACVVPPNYLTPLISHCTFILSCHGVDTGVQHGIARVLCLLADRLLVAAKGIGPRQDGEEVMHILFTSVMPSLRKLLRAQQEDIYRGALRIVAHFVRHLAPHANTLEEWRQSRKTVADDGEAEAAVAAAPAAPAPKGGGAAANAVLSNFGNSASALLHVDLLPLLRQEGKGDEGGDVFANLLHLQRHRRGRGLLALQKAAEEGKLTSNTLSHFVVPLCLQALLQRGATAAAFDPNYSEMAIKCMGSCMRSVAWSTCMTSIRFLFTVMPKVENREKWIIRAVCECLGRFRYPEREQLGPEVLTWAAEGAAPQPKASAEDEDLGVELPGEDAGEQPWRKGKGGKKGKKGKGKGKGKGGSKGKGTGKGKSGGKFPADAGKSSERPGVRKDKEGKGADEDAAGGKPPEPGDGDSSSDEDEAAEPKGPSDGSANVAKSLKTTVLPLLKKIVWQKGPTRSKAGSAGASKKGDGGKASQPTGGLVRISVIGVMMHCVKHLAPEDFATELPRVLALAVQGLQDRDVEHRRVARQATQRIAQTLGPEWSGWLLAELRSRLTRGYQLAVGIATSLAAIQVLTQDPDRPLKPGDLDPALHEVLSIASEEVDRAVEQAGARDEDAQETRRGVAPEAKRPKGGEMLLLVSRYATPKKAVEALWYLDARLAGPLAEDQGYSKRSKGAGVAAPPPPSRSMLRVRRIEELMTKVTSGLCLNTGFVNELQVSACAKLLDTAALCLQGISAELKAPASKLAKGGDGEPFVMQVAKSREEAFTVQPGAASGRSAGGTAEGGRSGGAAAKFDPSLRAAVLGVLGLRLLREALKRQRPLPAPAGQEGANMLVDASADAGAREENAIGESVKVIEDKVVPAVVDCFCSRQDRLFVAAGRCLVLLRGRFANRPEVLGAHGAKIAKTVLKTFEIVAGAPQLSQYLQSKAKARGLSGMGAAATLATGTRLLSALLNSAESTQWFNPLGSEEVVLPALMKGGETKPTEVLPPLPNGKKRKAHEDAVAKLNFFDALVTHIRSALDSPALQPSALQLLRRVLLRNRVLTAPVYQCIDAIGEVMVTAPDKRISQQCAQIYVDFMLDYPHEQRALQKRLQHLAGNLGYGEESGRRAVLNCMYLVVLNFPQAELAGKWSGLLFVSAAARLPQESDPTAHQMLHVLLKALLGRVGADGRQKLLEVCVPWARSPKRVLHAALAECLGLFAEASEGVDGFLQLLRLALPVLASIRRAAAAAEKDPTVQLELQMGKGTPPWRATYAVHRALERMLDSAPEGAWERIGSPLVDVDAELAKMARVAGEKVAKQKRKGKDAKKAKVEAPEQPEQPPDFPPDTALAYLWQDLLSGSEVFVDPGRHPWVVAVALRTLQSRLARCAGPDAKAARWFGVAQQAKGGLNTLALMRALADLLGSERLEVEPTLAKLGVTALRGFVTAVLRDADLMPAQIQDVEKAEQIDGEDAQKVVKDGAEAEAADDSADDDADDAEAEEDDLVTGDERPAEETKDTVDPEVPDSKATEAVDGAPADEAGEDGAKDHHTGEDADDGDANESEGDAATERDPDEEQEDEDEDPAAVEDKQAAAGELDGDRHRGELSLFEVATVDDPGIGAAAGDVVEVGLSSSSTAPAIIESVSASDPLEVLKRSRTLWLAVRLSFRARSFLARPTQHVIRLIAILRFFTGLAEMLPPELLAHMLEPLLSPAHRCSSFLVIEQTTLPEVQSLEEVLHLRRRQQMEFLGQLAQTCIDSLSKKMQDAGMGSDFAKAMTSVRKAVEKQRAKRVMERRMKPVRDPQAAAADKRAKNKRKIASKKRNVQEHIVATKGAKGVTRVKTSRSLV